MLVLIKLWERQIWHQKKAQSHDIRRWIGVASDGARVRCAYLMHNQRCEQSDEPQYGIFGINLHTHTR